MSKTQFPVLDWVTGLPLYKIVELDDESVQQAAVDILAFSKRFDQFCPGCGEKATFAALVDQEFSVRQRRLQAAMSPSSGPATQHSYSEFRKEFRCTREGHALVCFFLVTSKGFMKIGQYPSTYDISAGDLQEFKKALGASNIAALNRAIGLHSFGVGIGAFIYLRRVFESLVEDARTEAAKAPGWDESAFRLQRMSERIETLQHLLPEVLVENRNLYAVLSDHVHNLSEADCLTNFAPVLQGIFAIADDRMAELRRAERLANFNKVKGGLTRGSAKPANAKQS